MSTAKQPSRLLIDADDTLWENNIYFEQAIHNFIQFLAHSALSPQEVRIVIESADRTLTGYGSASFTHGLVETYRQLAERTITDEDMRQVRRFGEQIIEQPIILLDGVKETLAALAPHYHLMMLTKGDEWEQKLKVERSGLENYFKDIIVVPEKNVQTYRNIIETMSLDPPQTWMIGNSPRSDINPALAAGLNAIFIPHPHTWHLEHEEIQADGPGQLLTFESFGNLREFFL
jgi:putative hydrolase of the HAD superfamily